MKITNNIFEKNFRQLTKVEWQKTKDSCQIFKDASVDNQILGKLNISIRGYEDGYNRWIIEVKNFLNKVLGTELISINGRNREMLGYNIEVLPEYRRKKFRIGELMRLFSIMEMVENNVPYLKIYSKDTAVFFHSKYRFVPAETTFDGRNKILLTIANDNSINFTDLKRMATDILKKIDFDIKDAEKQRQYCIQANDLAKEYISRALQDVEPDKKHPFSFGLTMRLYLEDVIKNREFFNERFKSQGIDYEV